MAWQPSVGEPKSTATERREVYFAGRVQGVGFRYTTRDIAGRFPVLGFVQNLPDGRVLVVAEGTSAVLEGFLEAIDAEMGRFIVGKQVSVRRSTGEFAAFEIRR